MTSATGLVALVIDDDILIVSLAVACSSVTMLDVQEPVRDDLDNKYLLRISISILSSLGCGGGGGGGGGLGGGGGDGVGSRALSKPWSMCL